jgi:hypothetical protein
MDLRRKQREKIEKGLYNIKYDQYKAGIQFLSHDTERLMETVSHISEECRKIKRTIRGRKKAAQIKPIKKRK